MNNKHIIVLLDDLDMCAHLAKLSTVYSYKLEFCDRIDQIKRVSDLAVIIIDLNSISKKDVKKLDNLKKGRRLTFVGCSDELSRPLIHYSKEIGCDIFFKQHDLMKNLDSILNNIFNDS